MRKVRKVWSIIKIMMTYWIWFGIRFHIKVVLVRKLRLAPNQALHVTSILLYLFSVATLPAKNQEGLVYNYDDILDAIWDTVLSRPCNIAYSSSLHHRSTSVFPIFLA